MVLNSQPSPSENTDRSWECIPTTSRYVDKIVFSPDGRILASFSFRSTEFVNLWDVTTSQKIYSANYSDLMNLDGAKGRYGGRLEFEWCLSAFFSPDGKSLTCNGFIWDLNRREVINARTLKLPFENHNQCLAVSPDLQIAVAASDAGTVKFWDMSTEKEIYTLFLGHNVSKNEIYQNLFSPDGKIFASLIWFRGSSDFYPDRQDQEKIKLWEVKTGMELGTIPLPNVTAETKYTGTLAFSSDGRILASNCGDICRRVIVLSEAATGKEIWRFEGFGSQDSRGLQHKTTSLAFSPDDQFLASGDSSGGITLWQLRKERSQPLTIKKIRTFIGSISHDPIQTLAFSPDGRTLASGVGYNNGGITLWDVKSGKEHKSFLGHWMSDKRICSDYFEYRSEEVAISPDGKIIATVDGSNDMIKLWDTRSGAFLRCLRYNSYRFGISTRIVFVGEIVFSQDGKFLISVHESCNTITPSKIFIWEVTTGKKIKSIKYRGYDEPFASRTINQYGDLLAVIKRRECPVKILQVRNGKTVCTLAGDYDEVWQIIFSPDKRLIATRHNISEFAIWEIETGRLIRILNTDHTEKEPVCVLFSPDGEILAIANTNYITLWQVSSGEKIRIINRFQPNWHSYMAFTPDGKTLAFTQAVSNSFSTINLWDIDTDSNICTLELGSIYQITSLNFSGNGEFLVSSTSDGGIRVWQQNSSQ